MSDLPRDYERAWVRTKTKYGYTDPVPANFHFSLGYPSTSPSCYGQEEKVLIWLPDDGIDLNKQFQLTNFRLDGSVGGVFADWIEENVDLIVHKTLARNTGYHEEHELRAAVTVLLAYLRHRFDTVKG